MPYAQKHYPFENQDSFGKSFPADFIAEGLDQTRGWFYTLLVLSTLLFDKPAFKNLIINGLVLAADGKKMSKSLKNYPEPSLIINSYGADALRIYLINSPVVRAEPLRFKDEGVRAVIKDVLLPWYNVFKFFTTQVENMQFKYDPKSKSDNYMDKWILASCQSLIQFVKQEMEGYRLYTVIPRLLKFIDELSNWYLRFNRKRLKGENGEQDKLLALNTLFEILMTMCITMAPFTPFITETMYKVLLPMEEEHVDAQGKVIDVRSVHFRLIPDPKEQYFNHEIERAVSNMQVVIELGRVIREQKNISLKTPLQKVIVVTSDENIPKDVKSLEAYILEELNCREIEISNDEELYGVNYKAIPNLKLLGQKLRTDMPKVKKLIEQTPSSTWKEFLETKSLTLMSYNFSFEEIQVLRYMELPEEKQHLCFNISNNVIVLLDTRIDESLRSEGLAREIINRVQKLRKKANLQQSDVVKMTFKLHEDKDSMAGVFESSPLFEKILKGKITSASENSSKYIIEEEFTVESSRFTIYLHEQ
jgi:isoleucyl-tRNA synthetase